MSPLDNVSGSVTHLLVRALSAKRAGYTLFKGLNFKLMSGDRIQITGANGSGKTTLLRILLNLAKPHQGRVDWFCHKSERLFLGHKLGLKADLTLQENLQFNQQLQGQGSLTKSIAWQHFAVCQHRLLHKLSTGQQRRSALLRLLHQTAKVWILDEPFTALDQSGMDFIASLMSQHSQQGGSIIFTSHQPLPTFLNITQRIDL